MNNKDYIAVVGGINIDLCAKSFAPLREKDSNPGSVSTSFGGVGRNIAHNLCLLNIPVKFFGVCGDDANGKKALQNCEMLGMDMSYVKIIPQGVTSTYLFIENCDGEMNIAVSDMRICEELTQDYIASNLEYLNNARLVIFDTNAPKDTLEYLADHCTAPLFCDPVSTAKAEKIKNIIGKIHTLKPNKLEAEYLTGISISDTDSLKKAAQKLLDTGLKQVFISMGSDGVYAMSKDESCLLPIISGKKVNSTGCGDAFMAAAAYSFYHHNNLRESALAGQAAGSIAIESSETINPEMSEKLLKERMELNP